jgi:hypothetical protein
MASLYCRPYVEKGYGIHMPSGFLKKDTVIARNTMHGLKNIFFYIEPLPLSLHKLSQKLNLDTYIKP